MKQKKNIRFLLPLILFLAFILRIVWVNYGLPDFFEIDEGFILMPFVHGEAPLNPYVYPQFIYLSVQAIIEIASFFNIQDYNVYLLIGRFLNNLYALIQVFMVFLIARRAYSKPVGYIAAFLLAVLPIHISLSSALRPDMPMTLMVLVGIYYLLGLLEKEYLRLKDYLIFSLIFALALSIKYPAAAILIPFLYTHYLKRKGKEFFTKELFIVFIATAVLFVLFNPMHFIEFKRFFATMRYEASLQSGSSPFAYKHSTWIKYLIILIGGFGEGLWLISILAIFRVLLNRGKEDVLILLFPLVYFGVMGYYRVANARFILPVVPFMVIISADLIFSLFERFRHLKRGKLIILVSGFLLLSPTLYRSGKYVAWAVQKDTRFIALEWVEENIPPGSSLLIDSAGSPINILLSNGDPRYSLFDMDWMQPPEKHITMIEEGRFDYFILDRYQRSRYPEKAVRPVQEYIENNFEKIAEFRVKIGKPKIFHHIYYRRNNPHILIFSAHKNEELKISFDQESAVRINSH